jgi:hypothetical protein
MIHAENIYSARFKMIQGVTTLTQIVFHEPTEEAVGDFASSLSRATASSGATRHWQ